MLKADHEREWKQYQRKARAIDLRMTDWRLLKQQTDAVAQQQKSIQDRLDAARKVPLDEALLKDFVSTVEATRELGDVPESRGEKISFPLNQVIPGWTEGVQLMVVGEKRRFWIPAKLAYGENPQGGAPAGMLCFDVELFSIR